jgi:protease PrsW
MSLNPIPSSNPSANVMKWAIASFAVLVASIIGMIVLALIMRNTGPVALVLGMILAMLPVPAYLALALWLDRYETEPPWMLIAAFLWGSTVSMLIAYVFNTLGGTLVGAVAGPAAGQKFAVVLSAPFVEESAKAVVLFVLFWWKKDEFDGVIDGIVYAAMVGLGFAMSENILYYGRAFAGVIQVGPLPLFIIRGVFSPFSHPLFTSMTGIGLGLSRHATNPAVRWGAPLGGLLGAMLLHFLWNLSGQFGPMFFVAYLLLMVPTFLAVLGLVLYSLRKEAQVVREQLGPEVAAGLLTPEEVELLCSVSGRCRASLGALQKGGFRSWTARGHFHQTASELAFHRRRVAAGILHPDQDAAREAGYVARLQQLKASLG